MSLPTIFLAILRLASYDTLNCETGQLPVLSITINRSRLFRILCMVFLCFTGYTSMAFADPYPPQPQWLTSKASILEDKFLSFEPEDFTDWQIGKIGDQERIWTYFCGLGPYHGGVVIFSLAGELLHVIDDVSCVRSASSYDVNWDGQNELVIIDYGTGTGFQQEEISLYFFEGKNRKGSNTFVWTSKYETSDSKYYGNEDSPVLISYAGDVKFVDNDKDSFKERLSYSSVTKYSFTMNSELPAPPDLHEKEGWYWDKILGKYSLQNN